MAAGPFAVAGWDAPTLSLLARRKPHKRAENYVRILGNVPDSVQTDRIET